MSQYINSNCICLSDCVIVLTSMMCQRGLWSQRWTAWYRSVWALWEWTSTSPLRCWWGTWQKTHLYTLAHEYTHTHTVKLEMKQRPRPLTYFPSAVTTWQASFTLMHRSYGWCMHTHIHRRRSASFLLRLMLHTLTSLTGATGIDRGD